MPFGIYLIHIGEDDFESIEDAQWFRTEEERDKEFNKLVKDLDNQFLDHIRKMVFQ